jgi:hypothetical protein
MRNLFDDFLDELRRREAIARGEDPGPPRQRGDRAPDDRDEEPDGSDDPDRPPTDGDEPDPF